MKSFAVFDIDGTLIRWQLYHAVVNELAKRKLLGPSAYEEIRQARMVWKVRSHPEAFKDYERRVVDLFDAAVASISVNDFQQVAKEIIKEYQDQVYTFTRDLVGSLKRQGYILLAISGSQFELVEALAAHYGFDDATGSVYVQKNGRFTGEKQVASFDKAKELETLTKKHGLTYENSYAIGDSPSDVPMLKMVEHPIAFNPDRALFETAKSQGWKVVIERKNMIYELEHKHGQYVLV